MSKAKGAAGLVVREVREVAGWPIAFAEGEEEPRIDATTLGRRLGFERARDARKLIQRHVDAENLNDSDVRATVARTKIGVAERLVEELYLTEAAALFIVTKSETPVAVALTKEMIQVFMLARRGALGQAVIGIPVEQHARELAIRDEQIAKLERLLTTHTAAASGVIGPEDLTRLRHEIRYIGSLWAATGLAKSDPAGIMLVRHRVLDRWFGAGKSYDTIPRHMVGEVLAQLKVMRKDAERRLGSERRSRQTILKFKLPFAA